MADAISGYQAWKDEDLMEIYGLLAELGADQTAQFFQPQAAPRTFQKLRVDTLPLLPYHPSDCVGAGKYL